MAYQQYVKYKDIGIAVNGVEIFTGTVNAPLVNDTVKNWMSSHLYGSDALIYIRDEPNVNPNFANLEVAYSEASDQIKGNWIADRLQDNGDYIEYYNTVVGDICKIRITRTGGSSTYIDAKFSIIYLGRTITENSARTIWQLDSGTTCVIMLMPLLDVDARMATFFVGFRTASFPAHWRDSWNIDHRPVFYQADYEGGVGQAIYTIFRGYDSGGGGGGEPYIGGGTSTSGGGENATFDLTSDDIDIPTLPSISASGAGLLTLYQVSLQNMNDFASYLWSPLFDVDTLKKLFNDPMDAIISLGMLPFTPTGGSVSNIFIGKSDSGVSATRLGSQYYEIDMGSLLLDTFYDSALDLNPYTKVELYLPYCGTVSINPDEFDGKSIHVVYHVDILTGACVVFVEDGSRVLVQSQGNILTAIPFTSKDFKSIFGAVLGDAAAAGAAIGALATGGISALAGGIGLVSHVALNTVNSKVNTPHGGQCASTAGFLSVQKPYLIITRPAQCLPEDNAAYQGYPAYITSTVGDLTGFIKISEAHFDGFTCTDGELKEIDRLLKEGVYVQ